MVVPTVHAAESLELRPSIASIWAMLAAVVDPEIPVVSIVDLGILRGVEWDRADPTTLVVQVTPTYSGCPATDVIAATIVEALAACAAFVRVETRLSPSWSSAWMTEEGRRKLREFGIASPESVRHTPAIAVVDVSAIDPSRRSAGIVSCPRCGSRTTELLSQFGSTACKAQYRCRDCLEPFDYFKPH